MPSVVDSLLPKVKSNLILQHDLDDEMLTGMIKAAVDYAEQYQHLPERYYRRRGMSPATEQAVIMLASHFYESRDGSTGGFYQDNIQAAGQAMTAINNLLRLNRIWGV